MNQSPPLSRVRIVLVAPQHPGNIGGTARAMKTMGLDRLALVQPREFPSDEAVARSAGAEDVLAAASVGADLVEAIGDATLVYGCTARVRGVALPELSPRAAAEALVAAAHQGREVALVFGAERTGLHNDDLARCHAAVRISANPGFSSLNLAAAVQVLCYELRVAAEATAGAPPAAPEPRHGEDAPATLGELEGLFGHLESGLHAVDFFKGRATDVIMRRLRRLYHRAALSRREVLILRGILAETERTAGAAGKAAAGAATRAQASD